MAWQVVSPTQVARGGAMGASLPDWHPWLAVWGNWEYLSQTNNNADCIPEEDRFKFVDDLSTLEVINLLTIRMSSFYMKNQVPNHIPVHGQFIESTKLKSQDYLNQINKWTEDHKMVINQKKTKAMVFNHTDIYKFASN